MILKESGVESGTYCHTDTKTDQKEGLALETYAESTSTIMGTRNFSTFRHRDFAVKSDRAINEL